MGAGGRRSLFKGYGTTFGVSPLLLAGGVGLQSSGKEVNLEMGFMVVPPFEFWSVNFGRADLQVRVKAPLFQAEPRQGRQGSGLEKISSTPRNGDGAFVS